MRKNTVLTWTAVLMVAAGAFSQNSSVSGTNDEIKVSLAVTQVLGSQVKAWNNHDLQAFMAGYWNSPDLTFFSGANERHGWQETVDRYKASYQSPGHEMGKLEFANMRVAALGSDAAFVRGEWHLTMSDGKTPHGLFTLVFRRFPDGWKIVHDHTSAAE
ncbi:L-asparaginase [Candidatus Sulfotelmatobacter kueseliae]|uniref:L-asparaginase n=1 Tax=Candidatus Sulfotelmatobacter kueseliae TaxID=2042962 RepID=A0A2U3KYL4_9BACT|nr:L-asparaginase [Candidatus Sulfotelmatobacter kueseliae]